MPVDLNPNPICLNCKWYAYPTENVGNCVRHAPCCDGAWPKVYQNMFCGDFEPKATPVA